ncbi:MAG: hypothetical protein AB1758_16060 [Candidatus Eremiobacterota bacterium]
MRASAPSGPVESVSLSNPGTTPSGVQVARLGQLDVQAVLPAGPLLPLPVAVHLPLLGDPAFQVGGLRFPARSGDDGRLYVRFNDLDPELFFDPQTLDYGMRSPAVPEDGLLYRRHQEVRHADGSASYLRDEYSRPDGTARAYLRVDEATDGGLKAGRIIERSGVAEERVPYRVARAGVDDLVLCPVGLLGHLKENGASGLGSWWKHRSRLCHVVTPYSRVLFRPFRMLEFQVEQGPGQAPSPDFRPPAGVREEGNRLIVGGVALKKRLGL